MNERSFIVKSHLLARLCDLQYDPRMENRRPALMFPHPDAVPQCGAIRRARAASEMPDHHQKAVLIGRQTARSRQSRSKCISCKPQLPAGPGSFLLSEPGARK